MSKTLADILRSYIPDGDGYSSEYAHNLNAAADALESQQSAPAGYVMVPVEPTEALLDAMWNNVQKDPTDNQLKVLYKVILATALKAEQPPVQVPAAQVSIDADGGNKRLTWYSHKAMRETPEWTKLYAAPQPVSDDARDAARYRWLRCRTTTERIDLISHVYDTDMDNHIDAAMESNGDE